MATDFKTFVALLCRHHPSEEHREFISKQVWKVWGGNEGTNLCKLYFNFDDLILSLFWLYLFLKPNTHTYIHMHVYVYNVYSHA